MCWPSPRALFVFRDFIVRAKTTKVIMEEGLSEVRMRLSNPKNRVLSFHLSISRTNLFESDKRKHSSHQMTLRDV